MTILIQTVSLAVAGVSFIIGLNGFLQGDCCWDVVLVRDIHQEYIEAGAEIVITNTFGTERDMLEEGGLKHLVLSIPSSDGDGTIEAVSRFADEVVQRAVRHSTERALAMHLQESSYEDTKTVLRE